MSLVALAQPTGVTLTSTSLAESATFVGFLGTADTDTADTFTYMIVDANGAEDTTSPFKIAMVEGPNGLAPALVLKENTALDFETKNSYAIRIKSTDSTDLSAITDFTIAVTNVNEAPTDFTISNGSVAERATGAVVGTLTAVDQDQTDTFFFDTVDADGNHIDHALFEVVQGANNGPFQLKLRQNVSADYEASTQHSVKLKVTDSGGLSMVKDIVVAVTNVNEAPIKVILLNNTIAEKSSYGTIVGRLTTEDFDLNDSFTYEIVNGNGNPDTSSPFTIVREDTAEGPAFNLVLKQGNELDYETTDNYGLKIKSTDAGGLSVISNVKVNVTNVNEAPQNIKLDNYKISEMAKPGMIVGRLDATDLDDQGLGDEDVHTFAIVDASGKPVQDSLFEILFDPFEKQYVLALKAGAKLDHEAVGGKQHSLKIKATDLGGLSIIQEVTVSIEDENEAPTLKVASFSASIKDTDVVQPFRTIEFADPDASNMYKLLTVAIKLDSPLKGAFRNFTKGSYDKDLGVYTMTGTALDLMNEVSQLQFDPMDRPKASAKNPFETTTITVSVTDGEFVVQSPAVITVKSDASRAPTDIKLDNDKIQEMSTNGTVVGKLMAVDSNTDETFTYTLLNDAGGLFALKDGQIVVKNGFKLDFEQATKHTIKVRVADSTKAMVEKEIDIIVTDMAPEQTNGSAAADTIVGGGTDDRLGGGLGKDVLTGGQGGDVFVFNTKLSSSNVDFITDFDVVQDTIQLDNAIFKKLGVGSPENPVKLNEMNFVVGTKAKDRDDYIIYNKATGVIYYDADGSATRSKAIAFAKVTAGLELTIDDFFVI